MLLLTDRPGDVLNLTRILGGVAPCTVVSLDRAPSRLPPPAAIVCDVAFDSMAAIAATRAALALHRPVASIPLLCLARDPGQLTRAQALAFGAGAILPHTASPSVILAAARRLIEAAAAQTAAARAGAGRRALDPRISASLGEAGASLSTLFDAAKRQQPIAPASLDRGGNAVIAAVGTAKIRAWLDVVWAFDDVTYQHCLLVAGLAAAFAPRLGLSLKGQRLLVQAALVHDIGKAAVPHGIVTKAGRLSPAETAVMRSHAALGHAMLVRQGGFDPQLLDIVRHHHEYLDGSGYPDGLRGGQISPLVRLVTICDIYAALIERRSYKAPASPGQALAVLVEMGVKLDGPLLKAFHGVVGEG